MNSKTKKHRKTPKTRIPEAGVWKKLRHRSGKKTTQYNKGGHWMDVEEVVRGIKQQTEPQKT